MICKALYHTQHFFHTLTPVFLWHSLLQNQFPISSHNEPLQVRWYWGTVRWKGGDLGGLLATRVHSSELHLNRSSLSTGFSHPSFAQFLHWLELSMFGSVWFIDTQARTQTQTIGFMMDKNLNLNWTPENRFRWSCLGSEQVRTRTYIWNICRI